MSPHNHLNIARPLAKLLDGYRLDPLLTFIPVVGNWIGLAFGLYIVWIGHQFDLPMSKKVRMMANVLFDFLIGVIPFFGIIGDFFYSSNLKNLEIIEQHLAGVVMGEVLE